jgi:hypothetical protein
MMTYYLAVSGVESISRGWHAMARTASTKLYDSDYYTWALTQAHALRHGRFKDIDLPNLVDEVEDMARSESRELESRLEVLLAHLLKWTYQPAAQSKSWQLTIREQRLRVRKLLERSPGLKSKVSELFADAYEGARLQAAKETPLQVEDFPTVCSWTFEEATDDGFWPEIALRQRGGNHEKSPRQRRGRRRA